MQAIRAKHSARILGTLGAVLALAAFAPQGTFFCAATPNVEQIGTSTAGAFGAPVLEGIGTPQVGVAGSFHFEVQGGVPFAPGVLFLARREQPLYSTTYSTTLWTGPYTVAVLFQCDANGRATIMPGRTSAALHALCGLDLISQATVFDFTGPGGATWTNGLRFRFGTLPPP